MILSRLSIAEPLFQTRIACRVPWGWKVLMLLFLPISFGLAGLIPVVWQRSTVQQPPINMASVSMTRMWPRVWQPFLRLRRSATRDVLEAVGGPRKPQEPWDPLAAMGRFQSARAVVSVRAPATATADLDYPALSDTVTTSAGLNMPRLMYRTREAIFKQRDPFKEPGIDQLVQAAVRAGFRGLDVPDQHYLEETGVALESLFKTGTKRDSLFIQTRLNPSSSDRLSMTQQAGLQISWFLYKLKLEYLDTLVLGLENIDTVEDAIEAWGAMELAVRSGKVRQLGISKQGSAGLLTLAHLDRMYEEATVKPAVIQTRYQKGPLDFDLSWCAEANVHLQSFGTLTANMRIFESQIMQSLAQKYGVAPRVLFFRFMMGLGVMPLITPNVENMKGDASAWQIPLTKEDSEKIILEMKKEPFPVKQ